ncbi:MAG TPA: alpha-glucan family phosphorylase [Firmicutes bacterium]|nr:alpha-glucan family phosphorylase [Bacillota bacterium]
MSATKNLLPTVAYFCMEFGLHPDFPIYSGGLGVLAGDYLKAAHDEGLPVIGVGILWRKGYTNQYINDTGWPYDVSRDYSFDFLKDTGVKVEVQIKNTPVTCKVWLADNFGNVPLYLLDVDLPENKEPWLTHSLYRGSGDDRIAQEIILGIGGVRALRALGIKPDVYHFNEGHAVLAGIEMIREKMSQGVAFTDALAQVRKGIVFTTHTPVPAGNESHHHGALSYVGAYNGLNYEQMKKIGGDPFNMTVAGLRLSSITNAVAALHGETANKMWHGVSEASPIIAITNGVHQGTWQDPEIDRAYRMGNDLWGPHLENKKRLLAKIKEETGRTLDPDTLLLGFARRAATYKRGDLILRDRSKIVPLLTEGKVQLVFSGKAHPQDEGGKDMVSRIVSFAKEFPDRVIFLQNYDMRLGQLLTRGCDVWLNNPVRPMEASGTSGMKAGMNGLLNLSTLDGWWAEGCRHGFNGWQFGDGYEGPNQDEHDLNALFATLNNQVIPTYYHQRQLWQEMMKNSITVATEEFSARRMVCDYYEKLYAEKDGESISA